MRIVGTQVRADVWAFVGDLGWWLASVVVFAVYLVALYLVLRDLFRDRALGGLRRTLWTVVLLVVPLVPMIVYVIVRGRGMRERSAALSAGAGVGRDV
jgi:hypothetical protein